MPCTADPDLHVQFEAAMRRIACSVCVVTRDGKAGLLSPATDATTTVFTDPTCQL